MIFPQLSRRQFILLTLQLMAATQLPACRSQQPVLGNASLKPLLMEDHHEALAHWAEKGVRDAVLLNLDTHDDMRWIPEKKIDALRHIYQQKDWQRFKTAGKRVNTDLYHIGNWIYAGGRLGIFREVYWVIPFEVLSMNDPDIQMRRFLKDYEFNDQEIGTFSLRDGRFHGTFHGIPLTVCDITSLPDISSPLLLSLDTDFFPPYSTVHEKSYLSSLHEVFQKLYNKKYRILDTAVCYSVNGDFLPPYLRWVGDTLETILIKPGMIDEPPTELLALLQQVDNEYRGTDAAAMLNLIGTWQTSHPAASLQAYKAFAYTLQNDSENAYQAALKCCTMDRRYCTIFPYIGTYHYSGGRFSIAEKFYLAGFKVNPHMANGLFQYGHCLRHTGRIKEAIAWYEKDEAVNGAFPTRFLIAEMQILLHDRKAAAASIATAVEHLASNRYAQVVNDETARALYAALDFCNREGRSDLSGSLQSNPAVINMLPQYPRG